MNMKEEGERGWEIAAERRIETENWNNEKETELWDEIEEELNLARISFVNSFSS
jgi:hypothetical protein